MWRASYSAGGRFSQAECSRSWLYPSTHSSVAIAAATSSTRFATVFSHRSRSTTITRLGQILAVAEERDLVARNPVRVNTRNRKLKASRPRPVYLDTAEPILALHEAATDLDAKPDARTAGRRAVRASPGCASAMRARCAGATSTSRLGRSASARRRPTPACGTFGSF